MQRYTPKRLAEDVDQLNDQLKEAGSLTRFTVGGRNGYQAADEYTVDADGNRIGYGVDRNVGCGTSREVSQYAQVRFYQLLLLLNK